MLHQFSYHTQIDFFRYSYSIFALYARLNNDLIYVQFESNLENAIENSLTHKMI